ncbi:MAG: amino acid--tRNA ligase-related protein [Coprococcus sp.]
MFEYNVEEKKIGFTHNPFSMPQGGLEALNEKDPLEILAYQYDIVCNGVELSSGAVRNHDMQIMVKAFEIAGYTEECSGGEVWSTLQCIPVWSTTTCRYGSGCRPYDHAAS